MLVHCLIQTCYELLDLKDHHAGIALPWARELL